MFSSNFRRSIFTTSGAVIAPKDSYFDSVVLLLRAQKADNVLIDTSVRQQQPTLMTISRGTSELTANFGSAVYPMSPFSPDNLDGIRSYGYYMASKPMPSSTTWGDAAISIETWVYYSPGLPSTNAGVSINGCRILLLETGLVNYIFSPTYTAYTDIDGNTTFIYDTGVDYTTSVPVAPGWHHIALTTSGGVTGSSRGSQIIVSCFLDGALIIQAPFTASLGSTFPYTTTFNVSTQYQALLVFPNTGTRIIFNQCLSTTEFFRPISPVTSTTIGWGNSTASITGSCVLLTHGYVTNTAVNPAYDVGIYDASKFKTPISYGGVVVSNISDGTVYPSGAYNATVQFSNALLGGNPSTAPTDYLLLPGNSSQVIGTKAFTIEFWIKLSSLKTAGILGKGITSLAAPDNGWLIDCTSTGIIRFLDGTTAKLSTTAIAINTWVHITYQRDTSNNLSLWVNGVYKSSVVLSTNLSVWYSTPIVIGALRQTTQYSVPPTTSSLNGALQDLRMTVGVARYTLGTNFLPPSTSYPNN